MYNFIFKSVVTKRIFIVKSSSEQLAEKLIKNITTYPTVLLNKEKVCSYCGAPFTGRSVYCSDDCKINSLCNH